MDLQKLTEQVIEQVKEKKDYAPLVGALIGFLLSSDRQTKDKIANSLVGAGLGYVAKMIIEKSEEE